MQSRIDLRAHDAIVGDVYAGDPRFKPIEGGYEWVGNASGGCGCSHVGYGQAGLCLMHARRAALPGDEPPPDEEAES